MDAGVHRQPRRPAREDGELLRDRTARARSGAKATAAGGTGIFHNVIAGIDGAEGGRDAVTLARLLKGDGAKLTLAYVDTLGPYLPYYSKEDAASDEKRNLEMLKDIRADAGSDADIRVCESTSVGRGLHELAEEIGADLLVLGSSRRGLLERVLLGYDTRAALNGAPCAVAIAPGAYATEERKLNLIGVAYNATPESEHALRCARILASEHEASLAAFGVIPLPRHVIYYDRVEFAGLVNEASARIEALGGVEPHASYGLPAEELSAWSGSLDLLITGSRSYGPLRRLVQGSTTRRLARSARCPLLILTRGAREADIEHGSRAERETEPASRSGGSTDR